MKQTGQAGSPLPIKETDLYGPVRDFLTAQGFTVRAEVQHCDVVGMRVDDLVVVELKTSLSLDLLMQAVKRQRICDTVYLAVPRPPTRGQEKRLRAIRPVLRRLELGLLVVDTRGEPATVSVVLHPQPVQRRREPRKRRALLQELSLRSGDDNAGGSTRRPLVTAYREQALFIAAALHRCGPMAPRQLRALGSGPKTLSIVRSDVYGWFERLDRALYGAKPAGVEALVRYADVVARLANRLPHDRPPPPVRGREASRTMEVRPTRGDGAGRKARAARPVASP